MSPVVNNSLSWFQKNLMAPLIFTEILWVRGDISKKPIWGKRSIAIFYIPNTAGYSRTEGVGVLSAR